MIAEDPFFHWSILRTARLPARTLLPTSYPIVKRVGSRMEAGRGIISGTVSIKPVSDKKDIFRLGIPLFAIDYEGAKFKSHLDGYGRTTFAYNLEDAATFIWRRYGINLSAFGCWEHICPTGCETLPDDDEIEDAIAFFNLPDKPHANWFGNFFYQLPETKDKLEEYVKTDSIGLLMGMLERKIGSGFSPFEPRKYNPSNPFLDIAIKYPTTDWPEPGQAFFFDGPSLEPIAAVPLEGLRGKRLADYNEIICLRADLFQHLEKARDLLDEDWEEAAKGGHEAIRKFDPDFALKVRQRPLEPLVSKIRARHIYFIRSLRKDRLAIIQGVRQFAEAKSNDKARDELLSDTRATYTPVADVGSQAFAHMTMLPTGVDMQVVPFREAALGIAALRIERPSFRKYATHQIEMRELYQRENGLPSLMDAANAVLRMPGFFAVGYVGFAKLAQDAEAYKRLENIETLATDFWCTINPAEVGVTIRTDGLESWWKKKHRFRRNPLEFTATEAFVRLAFFLNDVGIPISTPKRIGVISGIIQLGAVEALNRNGGNVTVIKWRPNPEISRLITGGDGITPHYMVVNHSAMFGYGGAERNICPAMQLWCEHRARAAYFSGNLRKFEGWLVTPGQDGTHLGTIAERLGFPNGRPPSEVMRRIRTALEVLQEARVVSDVRWGPARRNAFEQQVKICMSADYFLLYDGTRIKAEVKKYADFLAVPFAPQKRAKNPLRCTSGGGVG